MTPLQKQRAKEKRQARKAREAARVAKRKAKRLIRMAPKHALSAWSAEVRKGGCCAICGKSEYLNAHHLLPKERYQEFRLEPINGICLCPVHHKYGKYSAHRNMIWFACWLRKHRPEQYQWVKDHMGADPAEAR